MKTLVPLNHRESLEPLIDVGVDEFYLGFHDEVWSARFGKWADINRMSGFGKHANEHSFEAALSSISQIKKCGRSAFVTLNANCYTPAELSFISERYLPQLRECGIDGIIVSDVGIAQATLDAGLMPVASTMCAIYNSDIAHFWHSLGINRMILPRDISLNDMSVICAQLPEVCFEAFYLRNGCVFSDAFCLGVHHPSCGSTCGFLRHDRRKSQSGSNSFHDRHASSLTDYLYRTSFHHNACAFCATWRMYRMGISSLKIVGRADDWKSICEDVRLAQRNIAIATDCQSEEEFLNRMVMPGDADVRCLAGMSCYYPEVRFD